MPHNSIYLDINYNTPTTKLMKVTRLTKSDAGHLLQYLAVFSNLRTLDVWGGLLDLILQFSDIYHNLIFGNQLDICEENKPFKR